MTVEVKLPLFGSVEPDTITKGLVSIIESNKNQLDEQLRSLKTISWETLVAPIEEREDKLDKFWSPIAHLNSVCSSPELREAHDKSREMLSSYYSEFGQNEELFDAYKKLKESEQFSSLCEPKKTVINHAVRDFRLSGVDLKKEDRNRFSEIKSKLSSLASKFSNNVLDATEAWVYQTDELDTLSGLPSIFIDNAKRVSESKGDTGYTLTLDGPVYIAVMSQADNAELRKLFYTAYCTRASEQGPNSGQWDNGSLIEEILALKKELAELLGMSNYAEVSLATKMANDVNEVVSFLKDLVEKAKPKAENDLKELTQFCLENFGVKSLDPWDISYYSEKLKRENYDVSQEELRSYFTLPKVQQGLFKVAESLFSINIVKSEAPDLWHSDVEYYAIHKEGIQIAGFYFDLYTREGKRGGAWMDVCRTRRQIQTATQLPIAYLVCNFNPPANGQPSLLTHNDVTTLFHEFGHGLHHMLTQMDVAAVSGINGVEWDAVELPSQFLENWAWQPEVLRSISAHIDSGESLPEALIEKMIAAKNFQSGLFLLRQIEFGLFDLLIHRDYGEKQFKGVQATLNKIRKEISVINVPHYNRFQNGFGHIFSGGYSAGYYSYLWAEVLSADAFSSFKEKGIFSKELGERFLSCVLSQGGSLPASDLFRNFKGREPEVNALLKQCGIA